MEYFVFVPGIMGSELRVPYDGSDAAGQEVWPPTPWEILWSGYQRIDLLLRRTLDAPNVIRNVSLKTVYGGILDDLDRIAHARRTVGKSPARLIQFPYDWRLDLTVTARMLSDRLAETLSDDPNATFTLIAHSMGGLLARYALEAPDFAGEAWRKAERLVRLITIATPHNGGPLALDRILGGSAALGVSARQFALFASKPEFPSGYQLVPGDDSGFVRDHSGGVPGSRTIDPFSDEFIAEYRLEPKNIAANRTLRAGLSLDRKPCDYFFFAGTGQETATGMQKTGPRTTPIVDPTGGDETVPSFSAGSHRVPTRYVTATHLGIFDNLQMRRTLFDLLDAPRIAHPATATGREAGSAPVEDISVPSEPVLARAGDGSQEPSAVRLTINLRGAVERFSDRLRFEPVEPPDDVSDRQKVMGRREEHEIIYHGPALDSLSLSVPAPKEPGIYAVGFVVSAVDNPATPHILVMRRT